MAMHRLFWDDSLPPYENFPEIAVTNLCGSNSIVATGLTERQVEVAKFPFILLFQLRNRPNGLPTDMEIAEVYFRLFGVTL